MAFFYADFDGSGASAPYGTWATAAQDMETVLGAMSAGDTLFVQGLATDTAAAARTLTSSGTMANPCKIIGVQDGTTNTGTSVVTSDLVARGDADMPHISVTGGGNDLTFAGVADIYGFEVTVIDRTQTNNNDHTWTFNNCTFNPTGFFIILAGGAILNNCGINMATNSSIYCRDGTGFHMNGGVVDFTGGSPTNFIVQVQAPVDFIGVDLGNMATGKNLQNGTTAAKQSRLVFRNCKMPTSYTLHSGSAMTPKIQSIELIGCNSNASAKGDTTSYPDYEYEDYYGTINLEATIVRTGGADDGASGLFAYAMTPTIDTTLAGTSAALVSPWMDVWVEAGSTTITVHIANDTASTDFNEDEVWCEFYTPDSGDTAQHEQTFDPANEHLLESSTIITDDTGSTWGTGGNNHQKMSATVTPGFEGVVQVRLHFAKRYASSPATLFLDAYPEVT